MLRRQKEELEKAEDESSKVMVKVVRLRKQVKKLENNYDLQIAYEQEMLDQEDRERGRSWWISTLEMSNGACFP